MTTPMTPPDPPLPHWAQGLPLHLQQAVGQAVRGRMHRQTDAVQALLAQRWGTPLAARPTTLATQPGDLSSVRPLGGGLPPRGIALLAQLVQQLKEWQQSQEASATEAAGTPPQARGAEPLGSASTSMPLRPRLRSAHRFGQLARQVAVEQQVAKALRAPAAHAGPLNASRLVQRVLQHMQDLSPEYLHQFMEQMDTLLWLDENSAIRVIKKKSKQGPSKKR